MAKRKFKYVRLATGAPPTKKRRTKRAQAGAPSFALARTGGFLGKELKFVDYEVTQDAIQRTVAGSEVDPASSVLCLNATAQGDTESNRDGRRQFTHSIVIKGILTWNYKPSGGSGIAFADMGDVKVALVLDTQTNGAQLNAEDVFKDPTSVYLDSVMMRNLQYTSRFRVLKIMTLRPPNFGGGGAGNGTTDGTVEGSFSKQFSCYYNFKKPLMTTYTNTTAVIANIADNSLHLIAIASDGGQSDLDSTISYISRCRFTSG